MVWEPALERVLEQAQAQAAEERVQQHTKAPAGPSDQPLPQK